MLFYEVFLIGGNAYQCTIFTDSYYIGKCIFVMDDHAWIDRIEIDHKYRNRGYGSLLLQHVEKFLIQARCSKIGLICLPDNDSVNRADLQKFYLKNGFKCNGYNQETLLTSSEMTKIL